MAAKSSERPIKVIESHGCKIAVWPRPYGLFAQVYDRDGFCGVVLGSDEEVLLEGFRAQFETSFDGRERLHPIFDFNPDEFAS